MSPVTVLEWIVALAVVYVGLPELLGHYLGVGAVRAVKTERQELALTFDDGPGPLTPQILDLLALAEAKATFFMVGRQAERYPELVRQVQAGGHEVANHSETHAGLWWTGPVATLRQFEQAAAVLASNTHQRPHHLRPPWGQFNLSLWPAASRLEHRVVLWSVNAFDWRQKDTVQAIAGRIAQARPGAIVLLHDAGGDGRQRTVEALKLALPQLRSRGIGLVSVEQLIAHGIPTVPLRMRIWDLWESLYDRLYHVDAMSEDSIFRLQRGVLKDPIDLADGTQLKAGTVYGEIHLKNTALSQMGAIRGLRALRHSLTLLAGRLAVEPRWQDIEVFLGTTILGRPAVGLGFTVSPVAEDLGGWWAKTYRNWLMLIYHPQGAHRAGSPEKMQLVFISMSRRVLLERYGHPGEGGGAGDDR
ncbi:MAG: polysaccharide deacetylase family protein [Sulfobacillus sp.]